MRNERNERRRRWDVANDADPLEPETLGDGGAGAGKQCVRPELATCERTREAMQRLQLHVRGLHTEVVLHFRHGSNPTEELAPVSRDNHSEASRRLPGPQLNHLRSKRRIR